MLVSDFMTKDVISCNENQTVEEAAKLMLKGKFSVLPVIDEKNKLIGIITESDFVGQDAHIPHALASIKKLFGELTYFGKIEEVYQHAKNKKVSEVMTTKPKYVNSHTSLTEVVNIMSSKAIKRLPVVDDEKLVGIVTRKDLIKAFDKVNQT